MNRVGAAALMAICTLAGCTTAHAERQSAPWKVVLHINPVRVRAGSLLTLWVTATPQWPAPATVEMSLQSPHHAWTQSPKWNAGCSCFLARVHLARRVHGPEQAMATARVLMRGRTYWLHMPFVIVGKKAKDRGHQPAPAPTAQGTSTSGQGSSCGQNEAGSACP